MTWPQKAELLRKRAGLTRMALAEAAGIGLRTYTRYVNGEEDPASLSIMRLQAIARALHTTAAYLLSEGSSSGDDPISQQDVAMEETVRRVLSHTLIGAGEALRIRTAEGDEDAGQSPVSPPAELPADVAAAIDNATPRASQGVKPKTPRRRKKGA